ncbi:MAG TPA: outer membrane beta-barrel protein [Cyclobacteriaceae bacterium]|nr:outer membrane beta-barrel protein [Cyclobacteriaceae bacterium]
MKKLFFAIPLFFIVNFTLGQSMVPGYIVTTKGDTLKGFILDRNNKWSGNSVSFSSSATGSTETYQLGNITTMYLQPYNAMYHARVVEIDKKPIDMNRIEHDAQRRIVTDTVLLELIARGKITLYNYLDENAKRHFFVQKDGGKIEELPYVRYMSNTGRLTEMNFYQGVLQGLTSDCTVKSNPPTAYEAKSLTRYVNKYNECMGGTVEVNDKKQGPKVVPFVMAGIAFGHAKYDGNEINTLSPSSASNGTYSSTNGLLAGIGVDLVSRRESNRFTPGIQLVFQQTGESRRVLSAGTTYALSFTTVHLGASVKYYFTNGKTVNPYVKLGFSGAYVMKSKAIRMSASTPQRDFAEYNAIAFGYAGGVGASWKNLSLEGRYQEVTFPQNHNAKTNFTSYDLILYWSFAK